MYAAKYPRCLRSGSPIRSNKDDPDSLFLKKQPKEAFVYLLTNHEDYTNRYTSRFYVDEDKSIHITMTYHMGIDGSIDRGWLDIPFSAGELEPYRIESGFWQLIDKL